MTKIPVGVLGATGMVGQKFVEKLARHPFFKVVFLSASEKSQNKPYKEAVKWLSSSTIPPSIGNIIVSDSNDSPPCRILFSSLEPSIAEETELKLAAKGYVILSNCSAYRMNNSVPLIVPEINPNHIALIHKQTFSEKGCIITNPNCSVIGLTMGLKPLLGLSEIECVNITTLQALSGAGYPGISSMDIIGNVIPNICGEELKIETEPQKILGQYEEGRIRYHPIRISAQCTRVPVLEGHLCCISLRFRDRLKRKDLLSAWKSFSGEPQRFKLPSAPKNPIIYLNDDYHPQPGLHTYTGKGMSISIGRLRPCSNLDWKFVLLCHNTIRGAVGTAILNAELFIKRGDITN